MGRHFCEKYEDGKDGVSITMGGAGTSEIYIIEKNGVKKFFKQNEGIPEPDPLKHMNNEYARLEEEYQKYVRDGNRSEMWQPAGSQRCCILRTW